MTKRTKKVKAELSTLGPVNGKAIYGIWTIEATAEAYDAMVEQMAKAKARSEGYRYSRFMFGYQDDAKAALRAIGVTRPKEGRT